MLTSNALVRLSNRRLLQLQGADAGRFLQGIVTTDMGAVTTPQSAAYGAFLTTKGRVLGDCNIVQIQDDTYLLDYDESVAEELTKHWKRYKIRMKVKLEDKTGNFETFVALPGMISGDDSAYLPITAHVNDLVQQNGRDASGTHGAVFQDPRGHEFGVRAILPVGESLNLPEAYAEAPIQAYTDRRIFLGAAEGQELSDNIPLEASLELLGGVAFNKGCYVGQELTARTQFKGNVRKRFMPLALIPSSNQDLIMELSQLPFQRVDADALRALRGYLATGSASPPLETGTSLVRPGTTKSVGKIVTTGTDLPVSVAMMRLEHVLPQKDSEEPPLMQFSTADGAFHAVPFQPTWWPKLDPKTGKMLL